MADATNLYPSFFVTNAATFAEHKTRARAFAIDWQAFYLILSVVLTMSENIFRRAHLPRLLLNELHSLVSARVACAN